MKTPNKHEKLVKDDLLEEAATAPPFDPFALDTLRLVHDAVTTQSKRALDMVREAGLETP